METITLEKNEIFDKNTIAEIFNKNYKNIKERKLNDINRRILDNQYYINAYSENLKNVLMTQDNLNDEKRKYEKQDNYGNYAERLTKEIENIHKYKTTKKITITETEIIVYTNTLYINEEINEKRYLLGEMEIHLPFDIKNGIRLFNLTGTRNAYNTNMHHPHVFAEGDPCLGSFAKTITECRARDNFFGLYLTLINFCRTVDIEDEAGHYITAWDEVDEEGNIICKGKEQNYTICEACGRSIIDEDEIYTCSECGRTICEECFEYIGNDIICDDCLYEKYTRCDRCGDYYLNDEVMETSTGRQICEYCYENYYERCCECESIEKRENMIWDEETKEWYCNSCYNRIKAEESTEF